MSNTDPIKLAWDEVGSHLYETGVDHCVLFVSNGTTYNDGVPWNGIIGVTEKASGADSNALYADNVKYLNLLSAEEYGLTIQAYTYPDEFDACNGLASPIAGMRATVGQQSRIPFAIAYRTKVGNDTMGEAYGYKYHIVYGCQASPSEKSHNTTSESPEAGEMSWEVTTTPVRFTYNNKEYTTSNIDIEVNADTPTETKTKIMGVLDGIFGQDTSQATSDEEPVCRAILPTPDAIFTALGASS